MRIRFWFAKGKKMPVGTISMWDTAEGQQAFRKVNAHSWEPVPQGNAPKAEATGGLFSQENVKAAQEKPKDSAPTVTPKESSEKSDTSKKKMAAILKEHGGNRLRWSKILQDVGGYNAAHNAAMASKHIYSLVNMMIPSAVLDPANTDAIKTLIKKNTAIENRAKTKEHLENALNAIIADVRDMIEPANKKESWSEIIDRFKSDLSNVFRFSHAIYRPPNMNHQEVEKWRQENPDPYSDSGNEAIIDGISKILADYNKADLLPGKSPDFESRVYAFNKDMRKNYKMNYINPIPMAPFAKLMENVRRYAQNKALSGKVPSKR